MAALSRLHPDGRLAERFEVSGGLIRNAAVHAAFLAAAADASIATEHAVRGVALELRKLGRPAPAVATPAAPTAAPPRQPVSAAA